MKPYTLKAVSAAAAAVLTLTAVSFGDNSDIGISMESTQISVSATGSEWGTVEISGGGFVSGIVTGENTMYARTDVGGAYRYDFENGEWIQLMDFINETDRGLLSVDAMCVDPNDDNTIYMLCGCAYFSDARTVIFKSTDAGETFEQYDVTDLIQVHGNGYGRQCGEAIAVDPDNSDIIYCGGDTNGLIMSEDGGQSWSEVESFNDLGLFTNTLNWPTWTDNVVSTTIGTDYTCANGIATVAIAEGRVFVGVSDNSIGANMYVADVGSDDWQPLSDELPTDSFPSRITSDADGNLLICYVGGLSFNGTGGGIYRYDIENDTVTDISPSGNSFGACMSDPDNSDLLIATTCGVWSTNSWSAKDGAWGDWLYRSYDGGQTWEELYPGKMGSYVWDEQLGDMKQEQLIDYLSDGDCSWIYGKAIHWCGSLVLNPANSNEILVASGNGIFKWENIWNEATTDIDNSPKAEFHAKGIEEVVPLDLVSIPGGAVYSAIGDYDGFIHTDVNEAAVQYSPTMGSTSAIAYCPQNPDVMVRIAENQNDFAPGYYSLDGGVTWNEMANSPGGKAAITQLDDDTYRIFKSNKDDGNVSYSDDFGQTWNSCSGISSTYGSKTTYMLVEPEQPNVVYAYATYYNSSWFYSKSAPDFSDAHYTLYVSTDYGKTFTGTDICMYDQCDSAGRIAYLEEDSLILGGGWYGMYHVTDGGKNVEKLDVYYCKTVGYGAPEKEGDINTLYMYGKPSEEDKEGIYASQDGGISWTCVTTENLYGGTGNGNFIVGDMNEFGTFYMSSVGLGIVYHKGSINSGSSPDVTTSEEDKTTVTDNGDLLLGDANVDGKISSIDFILTKKHILESQSLEGQGLLNADLNQDGKITSIDLISLKKVLLG